MEAYRAILTKRDTRAFTDEDLDETIVDKVLQAGRMAGSAKNLQPCRFVVLRERTRKEELAACGQFAAWIPEAPVVIAVVLPADGREFDAGRTAQNMMLAAHDLGLASCPVTMHDNDAARAVLGAPEGHKVSIVLALGHPAEASPSPLRGPRVALDELVHRERW
ncbi:MAG TPA: nitroreductase family protein [Nonomuraea sp.]|nr:nitroreductase family protein [Nonomuraea sp.]